jgi:UDP-glucose 4-epimerase
MIQHNDPLTVHGDSRQSRCFCNVKDVVRSLVALIECPQAAGQVFNVGNTQEITIFELAQQVLELTGAPAPGERVAGEVGEGHRALV